ncbi:MAG TPA: hypothetical protein VMV92_40910 [Streptosporangiaceae bacterium]|nr:hypothetical protein [Streptosporangiaceae bacterium]
MAALIAVSAYGGALGLIVGFPDLGPTVTGRLPVHSPVLGGLALTAIVAVPCTVLAWFAARGQQRAGDMPVIAGGAVIGRFRPRTGPEDPALVAAIEGSLPR